jgi:hypothetical protein
VSFPGRYATSRLYLFSSKRVIITKFPFPFYLLLLIFTKLKFFCLPTIHTFPIHIGTRTVTVSYPSFDFLACKIKFKMCRRVVPVILEDGSENLSSLDSALQDRTAQDWVRWLLPSSLRSTFTWCTFNWYPNSNGSGRVNIIEILCSLDHREAKVATLKVFV